MRNIFNVAVLTIFMVVALSCERRPLIDPDHSAVVRVHIHTDGISNVTKDIYNEKIPRPKMSSDVMRVLFYDQSGQYRLSEGFLYNKSEDENGNEMFSGDVLLSPGRFRILAFNFDMPTTQIKGLGSWQTAMAYTDEISDVQKSALALRGDSQDAIYYEPDHLLVGSDTDLNIASHLGTTYIDLDARTLIDTYYIQIRVKNLNYASSINAVLTGLSASNSFADNIRNEEYSSGIYIRLHKSTDERIEDENKDVVCAVFNTFGRIDDVPSDLKVRFTATSYDGETIEKEVDMTPVFNTADARERHWLLIDEVWELPKPIDDPSSGGGWEPVVDDWENVTEVLPIK